MLEFGEELCKNYGLGRCLKDSCWNIWWAQVDGIQ